jgi:phosphoribosylanthranilate isomerase
MTKIKICGLFRQEDISYVNQTKPDFIGFILNFPKSHRNLSKEQALSFKQQLDPSILSVGVFVNAKPEFIKTFVSEHIIDIVQLHGEENEEYLFNLRTLLPNTEIWKAFRIQNKTDISHAKNSSADRILLDNGYGTGTSFNWSLISAFKKPMILAGGLTPENIPEAIHCYHPWAIDISSGVETGHIKDYNKIVAAISAAKER